MEEQNKSEEEKVIDFKETLAEFVKEPIPEITQEEAIKAYRANDDTIGVPKRKKTYSDEEENEDDEHMRRVKKELLESLARVDALAKSIFDEKDIAKENLQNIKVKKSSAGGGKGKSNQEQVLEQMRQKVQNEAERSREE